MWLLCRANLLLRRGRLRWLRRLQQVEQVAQVAQYGPEIGHAIGDPWLLLRNRSCLIERPDEIAFIPTRGLPQAHRLRAVGTQVAHIPELLGDFRYGQRHLGRGLDSAVPCPLSRRRWLLDC